MGPSDPEAQIELVRSVYRAFQERDFPWLLKQLARGAVLHLPGASPVAGTYEGFGSILAATARIARRRPGLEVRDVRFGGTDLVLAEVDLTLRRLDGTSGTVRVTQGYSFDQQGKIRAVWVEPHDQALFDDLLSS